MFSQRFLLSSINCNYALQIARRGIGTTQVMCGEPPKKRKKMDMSTMKAKVDRKIKKLEKEIKKLRKTPKQLKPVDEYVLAPQIIKNLKQRERKLNKEDGDIKEDLSKLMRIWNEYRARESKEEVRAIRRVLAAQDHALEELKSINLELYMAALQIDDNLLPFSDTKMIKTTPPNPEYPPPDGRQSDVTKAWAM